LLAFFYDNPNSAIPPPAAGVRSSFLASSFFSSFFSSLAAALPSALPWSTLSPVFFSSFVSPLFSSVLPSLAVSGLLKYSAEEVY